MAYSKSNTEEFMDLYRQLEVAAAKAYNFRADGSVVAQLERRAEFQDVRTELSYCRDVRNLLTHRPKIDGAYAVEPSGEMLELLRRLVARIEQPLLARDIAIPLRQVLCKRKTDLVLQTMKEMNDRGFAHVPILGGDMVQGVFSEHVLLSYLVDRQCVCIGPELTFADIWNYLPLKNHVRESFRFIPGSMPVSELIELFDRARQKNDKIGMVFVTQNGREQSRLHGIITAWDVAAAGNEE